MPDAYNQLLMGGGYRVAPGDYSPGILRLFGALGAGGARAQADRILSSAAQADLATSQAALNAQKIRDMVTESERKARMERPEALTDIVTALSGATPEQASASIRHFGGSPLRLPSDFPAVSVDAEDLAGNIGEHLAKQDVMQASNLEPAGMTPELKAKIGRIYGAFRGAAQAGGKIDDIGQALKSLLGADLTEEAAGLARGGDPSTVTAQNRLAAAGGGKAYEPYSSGQYGPYSQESGALARPEVFESTAEENRAQAGASRALAGERGARQRQTEAETTNLEASGMKEPGKGRSVRGGGNEPVYERKKRDWLSLYPGDNKGALEYASGQRPFRASDARKLAGIEAKAKNLTGAEYDRYVADASEEIIARNRGDEEAVARIRLRNATSEARAQATRIAKLKGERRVRAITDLAAQLKGRGFDAEEVKQILLNAGLGE